jgi:hypothetical protein
MHHLVLLSFIVVPDDGTGGLLELKEEVDEGLLVACDDGVDGFIRECDAVRGEGFGDAAPVVRFVLRRGRAFKRLGVQRWRRFAWLLVLLELLSDLKTYSQLGQTLDQHGHLQSQRELLGDFGRQQGLVGASGIRLQIRLSQRVRSEKPVTQFRRQFHSL